MKKSLSIACAMAAPLLLSQPATAFDLLEGDGDFKRFSISGGWLHAEPQGKLNPIHIDTVINDGDYPINLTNSTSEVKGIGEWTAPGTGLEADTVDTVGILLHYYLDDHWGVEVKAGIPPVVDIFGKGEVFAEVEKPVVKSEQISDLAQGNGVAATGRAWLPAALLQYQFGESGVNKFRPYVGVGAMFAYFTDLELNSGIGKDLQIAAGRLQLIKDGYAIGTNGISALESKEKVLANPDAHVRTMKVELEADNVLAPIVNVGATYDFDENWFAAGSISYAKIDTDATISVINKDGEKLVEAKSNIDIDPYITYLGLGYRF